MALCCIFIVYTIRVVLKSAILRNHMSRISGYRDNFRPVTSNAAITLSICAFICSSGIVGEIVLEFVNFRDNVSAV